MQYEISLAIVMGINIIFAHSLNMITGFCGQISLGHAAFYGTGAYCSALLAKAGVPIPLCMLAAMAGAGLFGLIVGFASLRVRHDFLAITTMGVGFLFIGVVRQQDFLGGEMGVFGIPGIVDDKFLFMVIVLILAALVIALAVYLKHSWLGFAFDAIAQDEDTARTVGIGVARYKLTAFVIGTALAGLAGALYAHYVKFIGIDSFGFVESVTVLSMVIVGGIGSIWGVTIVSAVLSVLPLWLQFVSDYKLLLYGLLLFFVMRFSPDGLDGLIRWIYRRIAATIGRPAVADAE